MKTKPTARSTIILKKCAWCEEIIPIKRKSRAEYNACKLCSIQCVTNYKWHRTTKALHEAKLALIGDKKCECCGRELKRRENEHTQSWDCLLYTSDAADE